jgi:uncharacterized protein YqjF (DUF2071 family)
MTIRDWDASVLERTSHRPWPMPDRPWVMTQTWHDLLFVHWPMDANVLRPLVPSCFGLDTFGGHAWLGIVPFTMSNVSARSVPSLPWLSAFPELNVRTYVTVADRPGVLFLSLDAGNAVMARAARLAFNLPYHSASMQSVRTPEGIRYRSRRRAGNAEFAATYRAEGAGEVPAPGSLADFLTARYCLYQVDRRGRPYRLEIHHAPWELHPGVAVIARNTMAAASGLTLPAIPPLLHYARRQDMTGWLPSPILE